MSAFWGTYKLNTTNSNYTPAKQNISEVNIISQPPQAQMDNEHIILGNEDTVKVRYDPIVEGSETLTGLNGTPVYVKDMDYAIDYKTGLVNRIASGAIPNLSDCYISYTYYGNPVSTILAGRGRQRKKFSFDCWASYADFNDLENDYESRTIKVLQLENGTSLNAKIFDIPSATKVMGIPRIIFSITFIEV